MTLSIRDRETDQLARDLAAKHGMSLTEVVKEALEDFAAKPTKARLATREARLKAVFAEIRALKIPPGPSAKELMDELYDEDGLPA
ncbi:MAG: type II toxin-antitoxin system VapB family antitoxin [Caulobacter sp.]|nr:type II toxin-antitoxin system VapB family antitoxin [Caulobacter sp.]